MMKIMMLAAGLLMVMPALGHEISPAEEQFLRAILTELEDLQRERQVLLARLAMLMAERDAACGPQQ